MPFTFVGTGAIADKPLGAVLHFNGKVYCGNENGGSSKGYIFNPADNTFTTFTLPASAYYPRVLLLDGRILFCPIQYCDKSWLLVNEDGTYQTLNDWTFGVNGASLMRDGKVAICNATAYRFGFFNPKTTYFEYFPNTPSAILSGVTPASTTLLPDGKLLLINDHPTYLAYIYNPFNNVWEQISLNGFTGALSNKGVMLYDGGLAVFGNYYGLNLVDIYSKKIIDIEAMYMGAIGDTTINILICPDGDIFVANLLYINKYNITNNTLTNVGYTTMPTLQRYPKGMVMLPSGKMFYCTNGADLDNNGFTIWDSSLGTLPKEVCLSAFYNRG
jgi:DNA-binding beta-propeller fold protein YncE